MLSDVSTESASRASEVGVIVVAYGSDAVLPAFLESIPRATSGATITVVADNAPARGAAKELAREAGAEYIALENRGYGAAINAAERILPSSVEWVLVSNPDVVLGPASIDRLRGVALEDPRIGAVGPRILNPDGTVYPSARPVPSLRTGVGHALLGPIWPRNPWTRAYRRDDDATAPTRRDCGWLSGACILVRRKALRELKGFDEEYFMYFEDVDFGLRMGRAGYRNVYAPDAEATHTGAHSTGDSAAMIRAHHRSARLFLDRKYRGPLLWPLRFVLRTGLRLRAAILTRGDSRGVGRAAPRGRRRNRS